MTTTPQTTSRILARIVDEHFSATERSLVAQALCEKASGDRRAAELVENEAPRVAETLRAQALDAEALADVFSF